MVNFESIIVIVFNLILVAQYTLTRDTVIFRPCGNDLAGFIQFVKWKDSVDNVWTASLNFSYYPHITAALIEINFEPLATVKRVFDACSITVVGNNLTGREWEFEPKNGLGKIYRFEVQPLALYPSITKLKVNGYVVCTPKPILTLPPTTTVATVNLNTVQNNQGQANTVQSNQGQTNTIQSDESASGEWPWHVAILYQKNKNGNKSYTCGGSLISTNTVLTAAHCVVRQGFPVDPRNIFVVAGETVLTRNIGNTQESPDGVSGELVSTLVNRSPAWVRTQNRRTPLPTTTISLMSCLAASAEGYRDCDATTQSSLSSSPLLSTAQSVPSTRKFSKPAEVCPRAHEIRIIDWTHLQNHETAKNYSPNVVIKRTWPQYMVHVLICCWYTRAVLHVVRSALLKTQRPALTLLLKGISHGEYGGTAGLGCCLLT
ncbi:Phenoloxidase-activating factor 3 [Eumeta japonica]|uniref:Phenoloxidase-activating factor 3 n=1 Tax=Eumeta variegata TaxID=151549 RepID=A0A4C1VGQ7_EUMVA|nr:Phenoloxidase-activating factor 3 [Eumeta japonica]